MRQILSCMVVLLLVLAGQASWYWPFGGSEAEKPRLSELIEKASELIGEGSDLAADGKVSEAVAKYQEALVEIDRVERENPDRAKTSEFATLRTKRAYVRAQIDSLRMNEARDNAKSVAVSDTSALERKLAESRAKKTGEVLNDAAGAPRPREKASASNDAERTPRPQEKASASNDAERTPRPREKASASNDAERTPRPQEKASASNDAERTPRPQAKPLTTREAAMKAIAEGDFARADRLIGELLKVKPNDAVALNLRAAKETAEGKYSAAEKTLDAAIQSNPRDPAAYYNMAMLKLLTRKDDRDGARRYYETGRALGGAEDAEIEERLR